MASATATSQEELEFDEQFRKWEEEFAKWKDANIDHPDKAAYRKYEEQFESVRVKLLHVRLQSKVFIRSNDNFFSPETK